MCSTPQKHPAAKTAKWEVSDFLILDTILMIVVLLGKGKCKKKLYVLSRTTAEIYIQLMSEI